MSLAANCSSGGDEQKAQTMQQKKRLLVAHGCQPFIQRPSAAVSAALFFPPARVLYLHPPQ